VANSERGYEEFAENCERLELEQPVALRHVIEPRLAPMDERVPAERVSAAVGEHALPFLISSMSYGSQGEIAFRAYAEAAMRADMLCMNGEGGEIPDMYGRYPKHRVQQSASGRLCLVAGRPSEWVDQDRPGRQARRGRPIAGVEGPRDRPGLQRPGRQRPDQPSNNHDLY
jgi:glutamate synthase (NADPH/NADH) large chain